MTSLIVEHLFQKQYIWLKRAFWREVEEVLAREQKWDVSVRRPLVIVIVEAVWSACKQTA